MSEQLYQVREFAARSGVTVRTLHHYDHLGLLKPTVVADSGYRLYSDRDLVRLQQIVTLKFIGLPLRRIKDLLDGDAYDLAAMLRVQRATLEERSRRLEMAVRALRTAESFAASGDEPDLDLFIKIIEAITMEQDKEFLRTYYTEEQMEAFARRAEANPDEARKGTEAWQALIAEVEASVDEDPASEHAQELAGRWIGLISQFTQGNPETEQSLKSLWSDQANWPAWFKKPYSDAAESFINRAMAIRKERGA